MRKIFPLVALLWAITFNLNAQYCVPSSTGCDGSSGSGPSFVRKITMMTDPLTTIYTGPGSTCDNGYIDRTVSQTTIPEVTAGTGVLVNFEFTMRGTYYIDNPPSLNIWVDWNQNGLFEPTEHYQNAQQGIMTFNFNGIGNGTVSVAIPANAVAGVTRMRASVMGETLDAGPAPLTDPCNNSFGEMEDYLVKVNNPTVPECATNPNYANGASDVCVKNATLSFRAPAPAATPATDPTGYLISVWTDNGGIVYLAQDSNIQTNTSYDFVNDLTPGETYYWQVKPYNDLGTNAGCDVWSFTASNSLNPEPIIDVNGDNSRLVEVCVGVDAPFGLTDANGTSYASVIYDWDGTASNQYPLSDTLIGDPIFNSTDFDTTFVLALYVEDQFGCPGVDTVDVYVKEPADAGTINAIGGTKICEGDITQLDVSNNVGDVAWWYSYTSASSNLNNTGETSNVYSTDPIMSDVYFIVIANNNGCVDSTSIFIEKNDLPIPPFVTATSNSFCDGDSVMLTANWPGTGTVTKVWDDANSTVGDNLWANDSGTFIATVTDQNGCSNSSAGFDVTKNELPNNPSLLESGGNCDGDTTFLQVGLENAQNTEFISGIMFSQDSIFNLTTDTTLQFVNHSAEGCLSDTVAYSITFDETPEKPVVDTITYKHVYITNPNAVEFYWYNEQGDLIATEVDSNFYPTESGKYVVVQSLGPCLSEPSDTIMVDLTIGINDLGRMPRIEVYPNPSNGQVFISAEDNGTLVVVNMLGSQIMQRELKKGKNEITIDNAGIFILMVEIQGKQIWQQKMVIE